MPVMQCFPSCRCAGDGAAPSPGSWDQHQLAAVPGDEKPRCSRKSGVVTKTPNDTTLRRGRHEDWGVSML